MGAKLSNSRKIFREQTPRMMPNRLLSAAPLSVSVTYSLVR